MAIAGGLVLADYWAAHPPEVQRTYVGRSSCVVCHQDQAAAYAGSHHDLAMDLASDETVLGDFDDATLKHDGMTSRMFRDGNRFMVHTEGEDGQMQDFQVKYVFGVEPLQQYMVEFDSSDSRAQDQIGRVQVLRISWDTQRKEWFYLRPPDVDDKLSSDDPLHWTGLGQRWQTMCADCHSTNLKSNFDSKSLTYHTTFSEIDVSCEACHGPGSLHVELAGASSLFWDRNHGYGLAKLKGDDAEPQLQACAPCHSRRSKLTADFVAGDSFSDHYTLELLREDTYFADGQIKDEVYVYGSFLQSRMYHKGIRCTDCHDPHSLQLKHSGNQICTSCHQHAAGKYDTPSHHHHQPGTAGAMCVNCHMPERTFMDVDPRRDHSLRIPRPDLSVRLGTPNACSGCHVGDRLESIDSSMHDQLLEYADWQEAAEQSESVAEVVRQTDQWCEAACQQWYGDARKQPPPFAQAIAEFRSGDDGAIEKMLAMSLQPTESVRNIERASALDELARNGVTAAISTARKILSDDRESVLVRAAAINVLMTASNPDVVTTTLKPLLKDRSRLVRTEAARVLTASGAYLSLSGAEQAVTDNVLQEVKSALMLTADRSGSHMSWALLCEARNRVDEAIAAYETAMQVEPNATGPRTNLAGLLDRMAQRMPPASAAGLVKRAAQLRAQELPLLARDAGLAPENAMVQYRYGLALYLAGKLDVAMQQLERAVELEPEVADFRQARDLLREKLEE